MKIHGTAFSDIRRFGVSLLLPGNVPLSPQVATYADLWRVDVAHEGECDDDCVIYDAIELRGADGPDGPCVTLDLRDEASACDALALFFDLNSAEAHLQCALQDSADAVKVRREHLAEVDRLVTRWSSFTRPTPCTLESVAADQVGQRGLSPNQHEYAERQLVVDAGTVFFRMYERFADDRQLGRIDILHWEHAVIFEMAREQLQQVGVFADLLRPLLAAGADQLPFESSLPCGYGEIDIVLTEIAELADLRESAWFEALAKRGLDFDPAAPSLAAELASGRDRDGMPLIGRAQANLLAFQITEQRDQGLTTAEDQRELAAPFMPASQAALRVRATP